MNFTKDQTTFINNYVKALKENNAVIFAGAGMSIGSGFFDWQKLLEPIATQLGLNIKDEPDLTALAQYYVDHKGGSRGELNQMLIEEYGKLTGGINPIHRILARLPIQLYWTTNYDSLIEEALLANNKTPDVKKSETDLSVNKPKRDAIVYKMHGDIGTVAETVLTKHEYEDYNKSRELFSNAFKSDFVARTFLFIGFSFNDPNMAYLISRIRSTLGRNKKPDYFFIKRDADKPAQHLQEIKAASLMLYGLNAIWIDDYPEIEIILKEIETRYLQSSIFISGSADIYDPYSTDDALTFLHDLSKNISASNYKIVSGFGLGVGSAVINGVLDNMQHQRIQNLDNYLVLRPFPQVSTNPKLLPQLWKEYRDKFIPLAGIAIFVFGNKNGGGTLADGMEKEFDIAIANGLKVIPVGATGFISLQLWTKVLAAFENYYPEDPSLKPLFEIIGNNKTPLPEIINAIIKIINHLNSK